jgi:hypothetical protein
MNWEIFQNLADSNSTNVQTVKKTSFTTGQRTYTYSHRHTRIHTLAHAHTQYMTLAEVFRRKNLIFLCSILFDSQRQHCIDHRQPCDSSDYTYEPHDTPVSLPEFRGIRFPEQESCLWVVHLPNWLWLSTAVNGLPGGSPHCNPILLGQPHLCPQNPCKSQWLGHMKPSECICNRANSALLLQMNTVAYMAGHTRLHTLLSE